MRVALAEDDYIYRMGLVRCLATTGADVVCEASSAQELLAFLDRESVDVVILDIRLSRALPDEGLRAAQLVGERHPGTGILLLSAHAGYQFAQDFFASGTAGRGYVLKENFTNVSVVARALGRLAAGQSYSDPEILDLLLPHATRGRLTAILTPREAEVLALIGEGLTNAAIADRLRLSLKSIEATVTGVFRKLGLAESSEHNPRVLAALRWQAEQGRP